MIKTFTNKTESEMVSMTHQDLKILILRIVSAVLSLSEACPTFWNPPAETAATHSLNSPTEDTEWERKLLS